MTTCACCFAAHIYNFSSVVYNSVAAVSSVVYNSVFVVAVVASVVIVVVAFETAAQ